MLDAYKLGKATKLSPEAPVPVVLLNQEFVKLGGAANVANNLRCLGCNVDLAGFVGYDDCAKEIVEIVESAGISSEYIFRSKDWTTITKTRVIADGQHVVRCDKEVVDGVYSQEHNRLKNAILNSPKKYDTVIFSDYGKGTISDEVVEIIKSKYSCANILADIKTFKSMYSGITCITPNLKEAEQICSMASAELSQILIRLKQMMNLKFAVVTLSNNGVAFIDENNNIHALPAYNYKPEAERHSRTDVTGAGDTFISILGAMLALRRAFEECIRVANVGAAIVVNQLGTCACHIEELRKELKENP
jgi:D-beta-D-heptose 7-phosphate kinase/D-beta-D-heptose 1-phosphate adenosyltransferase